MQNSNIRLATRLDFLAVGPFKTGTSWIYNYLVDYNQVALPTKVKETFFFDKKFSKGTDWYYSHFDQIKNGQKVGEIAPSYFSSIEAPGRIRQINPNCKIIVTLREPVRRLVSFYMHMKQRGEIEPQTSFVESLFQINILQNTALYYHHLSRWIDTFGSDNVKVIFFEELVKSPENFSYILCSKLNLEREETDKDLSQKINSSQIPINYNLAKTVYSGVKILHDLGLHKIVDYGKNLGIRQLIPSKKNQKFELSQEDFTLALDLVKDDVMKLETVLDLDLSSWKQIWQQKDIDFNFDLK